MKRIHIDSALLPEIKHAVWRQRFINRADRLLRMLLADAPPQMIDANCRLIEKSIKEFREKER
jgi:hypothetical protein